MIQELMIRGSFLQHSFTFKYVRVMSGHVGLNYFEYIYDHRVVMPWLWRWLVNVTDFRSTSRGVRSGLSFCSAKR